MNDGRSLARAVRVAGKVEPIFVDNTANMPAAILKMASTRTIYAQKADEARATGRVIGLPRWAVEIIPTLTPGIAVWDVNGNVQVVKHLITEAERPLVFTDRAMTEGSQADGLPDDLRAAELEAEQRAVRIERQQRISESSESTVA